MLNALNKKYPFIDNLMTNVKLIIAISLGIFLFLLFFQPFQLRNPDFNNRLIILATFGAITMVLLSIFRIIIPSIFSKTFSEEKWTLKKEILIDFLFLSTNSVAFSFFARFVGRVPITFHIVIIIVIITLCAVAALVLVTEFHSLKKQLEDLSPSESEEEDETGLEEPAEIEFDSENKSEYFHLLTEQIIFIKSANNYIEVVYKSDDKVSKRLIRSTLKSTEDLLSKYPQMIRCHRSFIVNKNCIQKVRKGNDGLILKLYDYAPEIHVSRQYVLRVKEALKSN